MATDTASPALRAYEAMAPSYDAFTAGYDHELWLERVEALARDHGLHGDRVLDVGCGTGKSAEPLLRRGYAVTACDLSPAMAAIATRRLGPGADVRVADMRDLPESLGRFDLITCLDDAVNYLATVDDLRAAFASARRVLADDGLYVFDVNTLRAYRENRDFVLETDDTVFCWRASEAPNGPNEAYTAQLDTFVEGPDGRWTRRTSRHEQRHFSDEIVRSALTDEGLRLVDLLGQAPGVRLTRPPDEQRDAKRLYIARRAS